MKNPLLRKILTHVIAIVIFLIVSAIFCKPVLEGNVLNQQDNVGWKGMAQNSFEYKEKFGHYPLWNPNLFSGMPNYQVMMEGKTILPNLLAVITLGTPKPINFFFLACICFYILCIVLRTRPVVAVLGGLGYAFSTYNAVITGAGHDTQMMATGLIPLLIAGLICTFEKRYWLGLVLTTFAAYQQIGVNHLQVTYYTLLIAIAVTIAYLVIWIRAKDWKHLGIAAGITLFAAIVGVAGNALILKTTSEYAKYTMRGGKDISIVGDSVSATKTKGLDTSYAFEYSIGLTEPATLIMPNAFGGGSRKTVGEESHVVKKLMDKGVDENNATQFASGLPRYWGGLPFTDGPAYLGVIIALLGIIGFVIIRHPLKWGLLAVTILGIFMGWGKNFGSFNVFLFEYLPMYNKFRAPAFAQVIPQFAIGMIAVLALQRILFEQTRESLKADGKKILYALGGVVALLGILYLVMDYSASGDAELAGYVSAQTKSDDMARAVIAGLKEDRQSLFGGQILRTIAFAIFLLGPVWLYFKKMISPFVAAALLVFISTLELGVTSAKYLDEESYIPAEDYTSKNFSPSPYDQQILQDKDSHYRVFNMGNPFNESRTSYFHKSIGGYHPAKLRTYQDIIEKYLSGRPDPEVLNMLNTRYIIYQDPQSGQSSVINNPDAYGPCWLVKNVKIADSRVAALVETGNVNLKDTAIVDNAFSKSVIQPQFDSAASIRLTKFDNDIMEYESNSRSPQFAVFSEIYYPVGWNAYLDGKKVDYVNANYVLRGLSIPAGKHVIKFVFEPASVKSGTSMMFISSIVILLVILGGLFMAWRSSRKRLQVM